MGERCVGHCCQKFTIPYEPEQLRAAELQVEAWRAAGADQSRWPEFTRGLAVPEDIETIGAMVVYLGQEDGSPYYTCKHFDEATSNCAIYETRPRMCSAFPYGRRCPYDACEWTEARRVRLPMFVEGRHAVVARAVEEPNLEEIARALDTSGG